MLFAGSSILAELNATCEITPSSRLIRMVCTKHGVTLEIRAAMSGDISKYGWVSFPTMA